jgi:hypothetical protein
MSDREFRIVGIDKDGIQRNGELFDIPLMLSSTPSLDWARIFDSEWLTTIYSMKRYVSVSGPSIVVHAALDELEKCHIPELRKAVQRTNERYGAYLDELEAERVRQRAKEVADEVQIDEVVDRIKFDD